MKLYRYAAATQNGAVLPDAHDVAQAAETLDVAQSSANNTAVAYALLNRATTLIHNDAQDTAAGLEFLADAREIIVNEQLIVTLRRMSDIEVARDHARPGIWTARSIWPQQFSPSSSPPAR